MFLRSSLALLACVLLLPCVCSAQTTVYASIDATQFGFRSTVSGNGNYDPNGSGYSYDRVTAGIEPGITWLVPSSSRLKAGIDGRFIAGFGSQAGNAAFASLRVAFVPHENPLSPYFQIGGGYIHPHLPGEYATANSNGTITQITYASSATGGAADFAVGLNIQTHSRWSIRALELAGYAGNKTALSTIGAGVQYTLGRR